MPQVSVIVLTYNADAVKLRRTLAAIAVQKDIQFEVIVSDDGSSKKDFSFLGDFCQAHAIKDYRLIENPENHGTLSNCISGLTAAKGEYVFLTSPGDYLYDPYTLRDFYRFAESNHAKLVFGNAVYYFSEPGEPRLTRSHSNLYAPEMYCTASPSPKSKTHFFSGNWIVGASYFRHRQTTLALFQQLADAVIYVEDNTSTALAFASGIGLYYYDRNIVWYEDGTGVSTGVNQAWAAKIRKDIIAAYTLICKLFPHDPYADYAKNNYVQQNKLLRILNKCFKHPLITLRALIEKRILKHPPINCPENHLDYLKRICQDDFTVKE